MSGLFENLDMFDEGAKVANRQAVAVANKRFNDNFAGFLRQASSESEFKGRLALVENDISNMVDDVAYEYGGDAEKIKTAVLNTVNEIRTAKEDPYKGDERPPRLEAQDEIQVAAEHSLVPPWLKKQIQDEDQEDGGNLRNKEAASDVCDKCECEPCECDKNEEKTSNINSQPVANPVPLEETPGYTAGGQDIDAALEQAPSAVGTGKEASHDDDEDEKEPDYKKGINELLGEKYPETKDMTDPQRDRFFGETSTGELLGKKPHESAAHKVEEKDDKFYVTEEGEGEVAGPFDSQEEAYSRANELNDLENLENEDTHKESGEGISLTITMAKALALKEAAAKKKLNFFSKDEWVNEGDSVTADGETEKVEDIKQEDDHKVVELEDGSIKDIDDVHVAANTETGDKTEERESLPTGDESALDGPSPKMDKKKWVPNATNPDGNLEPIKTEGENSPKPTHHQDIKQKPDYENEDAWEHDNNVWKREELPTAKEDEAGFESTRNIDQPHTDTWSDKSTQADPVTKVTSGVEKVAVFEDERDIIAQHIPQDYVPFPGFWQEMANLKRNGISDDVIRDLLYGAWRTDQDPAFLESIGITPLRDPSEWKSDEELEREDRARAMLQEESEAIDAPEDAPAEEPGIEEEAEVEETPEEIEEIIEEGDKPGDRVEVIHEDDEDEGIFDDEPSEADFEDIVRETEENPDDWQ